MPPIRSPINSRPSVEIATSLQAMFPKVVAGCDGTVGPVSGVALLIAFSMKSIQVAPRVEARGKTAF